MMRQSRRRAKHGIYSPLHERRGAQVYSPPPHTRLPQGARDRKKQRLEAGIGGAGVTHWTHDAAAIWGESWKAELAVLLGVNKRTVRRWAAGDDEPPPQLLALIDFRLNRTPSND